MQEQHQPSIISVMSEIFKLYRLQQVDSQLDQVNDRLAEIEAILGNDEEIQAAQAILEKTTKNRIEYEKKVKFAEEEVREQQIKVEQNQASLYSGSIKNPKELEDLQLEAEALKRQLSNLEDVQLDQMELLEEGKSAEGNAEYDLENLSKKKQRTQGELMLEQKELLLDQTRLVQEVEAASNNLSAEELRTYSKIREKKNGVAVAKVDSNSCSACGNQISQAQLQIARQGDSIVRCSSCKRILYVG